MISQRPDWRSAFDPKILLKVIFIALFRDSRPHFTTIANFVSKLPLEIEDLFGGVLALCDEMGLIGKTMFAMDGCKIPSNASKEWSGTTEPFRKKARKMRKVVQRLIRKHRDKDDRDSPPAPDRRKAEERQIETINKKAAKIEEWLKENEDRRGKRNGVVQSDITDNDSVKMKTASGGVIQGFNGIAMNDDKHQVIVAADAIGQNDERPTVRPLVEKARYLFADDPFKTTKLSAYNGFCDETNRGNLFENGIDTYIPDREFRKRESESPTNLNRGNMQPSWATNAFYFSASSLSFRKASGHISLNIWRNSSSMSISTKTSVAPSLSLNA